MSIKEGLKDWWQLYHISKALFRFRLGRPWATFRSFLATWEWRIFSRRKENFLLHVHFSVAHNSSAEGTYIRYQQMHKFGRVFKRIQKGIGWENNWVINFLYSGTLRFKFKLAASASDLKKGVCVRKCVLLSKNICWCNKKYCLPESLPFTSSWLKWC